MWLTLDDTTPAELRPVLQPLPAMTGAGTRLLDAASDLFYRRGVRAVGVDLIAETAGTTKKTLYDRFGSKDALVALYLLRRAHRWREHLLASLGNPGAETGAETGADTGAETGSDPGVDIGADTGAEANAETDGDGDGGGAGSETVRARREAAVLLVFDALATWMGDEQRGCAFVNAYAELGAVEPGAVEHPAVPVIRAEKAWMRDLFDTLTGDPAVGAYVHLIYEGTLVLLTAGADPRAAADARRCVQVAMRR